MTAKTALLKAAVAALGLILLTAQQDMPLRPPGRFTATTAGLLKGTIAGDVSASIFRDGHREIYLQLDSSQMMATDIMVSVQITQAPGKSAPSFRLQIENLKTHQLTYPAATGTLDLKGRDLLSGRFTVTSADLTLTGTLDKAPVVPAIE
jgi:hypothetical protein